jgi:Ca-activated chloride channel family protein
MLARDLKPSRLERAKREVGGLLERLRNDRVALIAFSGDAREVAPLTRDRVSLAGFLATLSPADNEKGGTDLAAALSAALALFDGRTGAHEAVVLLTDGEDLEGRAAALAEEARERGIQVFVVGVGTEAGGKIPLVNERGEEAFLVDDGGVEVLSRLDRATLENVAATTGGAYLSVEESATPLEELYAERITGLEGRALEGGKERVPHDRYQWPLALALLCMLGEAGLRERRIQKETRP